MSTPAPIQTAPQKAPPELRRAEILKRLSRREGGATDLKNPFQHGFGLIPRSWVHLIGRAKKIHWDILVQVFSLSTGMVEKFDRTDLLTLDELALLIFASLGATTHAVRDLQNWGALESISGGAGNKGKRQLRLLDPSDTIADLEKTLLGPAREKFQPKFKKRVQRPQPEPEIIGTQIAEVRHSSGMAAYQKSAKDSRDFQASDPVEAGMSAKDSRGFPVRAEPGEPEISAKDSRGIPTADPANQECLLRVAELFQPGCLLRVAEVPLNPCFPKQIKSAIHCRHSGCHLYCSNNFTSTTKPSAPLKSLSTAEGAAAAAVVVGSAAAAASSMMNTEPEQPVPDRLPATTPVARQAVEISEALARVLRKKEFGDRLGSLRLSSEIAARISTALGVDPSPELLELLEEDIERATTRASKPLTSWPGIPELVVDTVEGFSNGRRAKKGQTDSEDVWGNLPEYRRRKPVGELQ